MTKSRLAQQLELYEPMIQGIVQLFHPFVEVAIHDLEQGKLVAVYHNISQRKVGDASPLTELKVDIGQFPDYFPPYYKKNWDGRSLKCTSITIRDSKGKPIGLICINVDASAFRDIHALLGLFIETKQEAENPVEAFGSSCEEQAEILIQEYLKERHLTLQHINRNQKKQLVQHLYHKGLFNFKNAATYLGGYLKVSRASIYNYINEIGAL